MNTRCVVIGGGLIGLSIARKFSMEGMKTILLEANSDIGLETSYRNSAVIHAGLYYPTNSLKAKLCVRGKELLYEYCKLKNISHKKIGKLIVATSEEQLHDLANLYKQAISNGVNDVTLLTSDEVKKLEPNIKAVAGLLSPSTGILNGHQLMLAFESDIKQHGGRILCRSKVLKIEKVDNTFKINIDDFKEVVDFQKNIFLEFIMQRGIILNTK
jgi:L-2-hydroxyglutarate oxidase LhgO